MFLFWWSFTILTNANVGTTKFIVLSIVLTQYCVIKTSAIFYVYYSKMSSTAEKEDFFFVRFRFSCRCFFIVLSMIWKTCDIYNIDIFGCWMLTYGITNQQGYAWWCVRTVHYQMKYFPLTHILYVHFAFDGIFFFILPVHSLELTTRSKSSFFFHLRISFFRCLFLLIFSVLAEKKS